jgi:hypothetical protein
MPVISYTDKKGNVKRQQISPVEYLESSRTKLVVGSLGFHPGADRIYSEDGVKYLNRYKHEPVEPLRPKPHELEAWTFLIGRIQDDLFRRWLMKFYAHALKHPGVKIQAAPLLYSEAGGTGKSTLMFRVPSLLFGSKYVRMVSSDVVNSRFTGPLADTWWVVLDELKTSGLKLDRVHIANKLKPWITEPTIEIEKKGLDPYTITNRVQITATSNFTDALQIENDDRRWAISRMGGEAMTAAEKADLYRGFLNTERAAGVLKWIFQQESLTGFDPNAEPPQTAGKVSMAASGLGVWETKIAEAMYSGKPPFDRDIVKLSDVQDLLAGSNAPPIRKIGQILRRPPFNASKHATKTGNFWCWRNTAYWSRMSERQIELHQETGARPTPEGWSDVVPLAIQRVVEDDLEPETGDLSDLLETANG